MKRLLTLAAVAAVALFAGCAGQVRVTDTKGKPLQNVLIVPVTASTNGDAIRTDANGQANVPTSSGMQNVKWYVFSLGGFKEERVPVPGTWPLNVILTPTINPNIR
jgi:hypothetical protein